MTQREAPPEQVNTPADSHTEIIEPTPFAPSDAPAQQQRWRPNRRQLAIGLPLFMGLVIVVMLLMSRSVTFVTLPAQTQISVSGGLHLQLANAWLLLPGDYQIHLHSQGYHSQTQTITVSDAAEQQFRFELQKLPGRLKIETTPALDDVEIYIDDVHVGFSGQEIANIEPGLHTLSLRHARYLPMQQNLTIEGKDQLQVLSLTLAPAWATVTVNTLPAGATLQVGEQPLGTTPGEFEIMQGEQPLMLTLAGYKIWQEVFEFNAGEVITLPDIRLQKADGILRFRTRPNGASVTINGNFLGLTPLDIPLNPGRSHTLKIFKEGYEEATTSVAIASGSSKALELKLTPAFGKVLISANFPDAELYVDGRLFGRANQTLSLPARPHSIAVKKVGYETFEAEVTPKPSLTQQLQVRLRTEDQAKWDSIAQQVRSPTGQILKLFRPNARFTMGSSRREQGRRSNETLRQVALTRAFYVAPLPVTNADFVQFERFHSSSHVKGNSLFSDLQPVVNISWQQAAKFCNWLSAQEQLPPFYRETNGVITGFDADATGYRMLTEAEWAWLARVQDQDGVRKYPWGNQLPPAANSGNYGDVSAASILGLILLDYNDGFPVSSPVGKFPPNEKGIYDIGGNVAEWINDFYGVGTGLSLSTETDPMGPEKGDYHVIRGSSWAHGGITELRLAYRDYGDQKRSDLGFRIARFVDARKKGDTDE
ncbi:PEGA domain-containing protein [Simiduia aestuariiviva]|uniref:Formylglycine-generating enzyme required for sulfatase activity n=1 Tax=Simiduia aestuariiviva TaxID=1510459 RepID=A0A839UL01_9GAMM|nr:PEGA domain-containing protein [Simiduia aestuariiviva]MBB3168824.1 formylglycine-generating enzyme required for sulfatase activity [Simiduia aestuariiviva]